MPVSLQAARTQRLWTALITPLRSNGDIDFDAIKSLLERQHRAGNGVVILGSTGEGANLSRHERKRVVQYVCETGVELPLMVGVGGLEFQAQREWLRYCETMPIDAYLMVTPIYAKPGADGQRRWFEALMDDVSRPCMLYNVPSRAGVALQAQALRYLQSHRNLWAVKEASGDPIRFAQWQTEFPHIAWFSGDDALIGQHAKSGACGLVSVAANIWPDAVAQLLQRCLNADIAAAELMKQIADPLFIAANPIPTKALMHHLQLIDSSEVRLPLSAADLPSLTPLIQADQTLQRFFQTAAVA